MANYLLAIIYGVLGQIVLNVGYGFQKAGADVLKLGRRVLRSRASRRKFGIWVLGLALFGLGSLFIFQALSLGDAALISALSSTGLVTLVIFSALVLRERITRRTLASIGSIVLGTAVVGAFGHEGAAILRFSIFTMSVFMLGLLLLSGSAFVWARQSSRQRFTGIMVAIFAGLVAGDSLLFHNAAAGLCTFDVSDAATVECVFRSPFFYLGVLSGLAAVGILQYAYQFGQAIEIVPTYSGIYLVEPILGGIIIYSERVTPLQWLGVVLIAWGTLAISAVQEAHTPEKELPAI